MVLSSLISGSEEFSLDYPCFQKAEARAEVTLFMCLVFWDNPQREHQMGAQLLC